MRTIAVLAVQGAFIEHERRLERLGCRVIELRQAADLKQDFDGLVLPGGESSVQSKLVHELGMFEELQGRICDGLPTLGTCAGAILLASKVESAGWSRQGEGESAKDIGIEKDVAGKASIAPDDTVVGFQSLPIAIRRNAYGRQLASFHAEGEFCLREFADVEESVCNCDCRSYSAYGEGRGIAGGTSGKLIPLTFIRAPKIVAISENVEPIVTLNDEAVAVRYDRQIACAFHPELDEDDSIYELFLSL